LERRGHSEEKGGAKEERSAYSALVVLYKKNSNIKEELGRAPIFWGLQSRGKK